MYVSRNGSGPMYETTKDYSILKFCCIADVANVSRVSSPAKRAFSDLMVAIVRTKGQ